MSQEYSERRDNEASNVKMSNGMNLQAGYSVKIKGETKNSTTEK